MINVFYNTINTVTFYLKPSLTNPVYLISLVDYTKRIRINFISTELSNGSNLLQFLLEEVGEDPEDLVNNKISISDFGTYTAELYEQSSATNLDQSLATLLGSDELRAHKEPIYDNPPERNEIIAPVPICSLFITASATPETSLGANDGTASVIVSGDVGALTFAWTGDGGFTSALQNITGLDPGNYTITVSDDVNVLCSVSKNVTVDVGEVIPDCDLEVITIVTTPPTTLGGSDGMALATVTGNFGAINYEWENGEITNPAVSAESGSMALAVSDSGVGPTCLAVGVSFVSQGDAGASDFIAKAGITGTVQINALTDLVADLKGLGSTPGNTDVWIKIYAHYPYCPINDTTATREAYKWNLVNPLDTDAAFRIGWFNDPSATIGGIEGNGTNQYGDTHFTPTVDAVSINDFGISMRNTTTPGSGLNVDMGCSDNSNFIQLSIANSGFTGVLGDLNSKTQGTTNTTTNRTLSRIASNDLKLYSNGSLDASDTTLGGAFAPNDIQLLGRNHLGSPDLFSGRKYTFHSIHKGFTAAEAQDFSFAINKYDTALSR